MSHVSVTGGAVVADERSDWSGSLGLSRAWSSWTDADADAARLPSIGGGDGEEDAITAYRDQIAIGNQAMLSVGRLRGRIAAGRCRVGNRGREREEVLLGFFFACAAGLRTKALAAWVISSSKGY